MKSIEQQHITQKENYNKSINDKYDIIKSLQDELNQLKQDKNNSAVPRRPYFYLETPAICNAINIKKLFNKFYGTLKLLKGNFCVLLIEMGNKSFCCILQSDWDNKDGLDKQWCSNNNVVDSDYNTYSSNNVGDCERLKRRTKWNLMYYNKSKQVQYNKPFMNDLNME